MLRTLTILTAACLLLTVPVLAQTGSSTQEGDQSLPAYLDCRDLPLAAGGQVDVVPGASFELTSDEGDFDLFLYDEDGEQVASFQDPGDEAGTIHADAATGEVCLWGVHDPTGQGLPMPGQAHWVFTQVFFNNGRP